jgi:hypothetical protein
VPPERCAGKEGHNTPTIGGFVMLPPVVFANAWRGEALMKRAVVEHLRLTHDSELLAQRAEVYAALLADLARGKPLREAAAAAGKAIGVDVVALAKDAAGNDAAVVGRRFSTACYITDRHARANSATYLRAGSTACLRAAQAALTCVLPPLPSFIYCQIAFHPCSTWPWRTRTASRTPCCPTRTWAARTATAAAPSAPSWAQRWASLASRRASSTVRALLLAMRTFACAGGRR